MTYSPVSIFIPTGFPTQDIFAKYLTGFMIQKMPFKLYSNQSEEKLSQAKKRMTRGPYRKYTAEQKRDIIQQILEGATLKSIAEKTEIPKRNLIRWKHQFLQNRAAIFNAGSVSEESGQFCETKPFRFRKQSIETKSTFSEPISKTQKIEE